MNVKPGDWVRHKLGGSPMQVISVTPDEIAVRQPVTNETVWFSRHRMEKVRDRSGGTK